MNIEKFITELRELFDREIRMTEYVLDREKRNALGQIGMLQRKAVLEEMKKQVEALIFLIVQTKPKLDLSGSDF